jgi:hypothetical protein
MNEIFVSIKASWDSENKKGREILKPFLASSLNPK